MDKLGQRIIDDMSTIFVKRVEARELEQRAAQLRREADEMERLLELARCSA